MRFSPIGARLTAAFVGLMYPLPLLIAGRVVSDRGVGGLLTVAGLFLGAVTVFRGLTVSLTVESDELTIRNRWRTTRFSLDDRPQLVQCTPWWASFIGAATVDYLGVAVSGRAFPTAALATVGRTLDSPDLKPIVDRLAGQADE